MSEKTNTHIAELENGELKWWIERVNILEQRIAELESENEKLEQSVMRIYERNIILSDHIAELKSELNNCVKVLEQVDFTSGCNGHKCVSGHIKTLIEWLEGML